jgi:hypothetical protein
VVWAKAHLHLPLQYTREKDEASLYVLQKLVKLLLLVCGKQML